MDLTGHTYDGRCKRLVNDAINVLVFVVLDVCTIALTVSSTVAGVVAVMSSPRVLGVPAAPSATAAVGARLGMGEDIIRS